MYFIRNSILYEFSAYKAAKSPRKFNAKCDDAERLNARKRAGAVAAIARTHERRRLATAVCRRQLTVVALLVFC